MMQDPNKTIFFAVNQGFTTRFLLQTDIIKNLKQLGNKIVLITPNYNDETFCANFIKDDVAIEKYDYENIFKVRQTYLYQVFTKIRRFVLPGNLDLSTLLDKEMSLIESAKEKKFLAKINDLYPLWIAKLLRKSRFLRKVYLWLESRLFYRGFHERLFKKYKPALLVLADLGTIDISNFIMRESKEHNVPIASIILSWDNLTSKGIGGVKPDYCVAWNENMAYELEEYHDVPASRIFTGGIPHFDFYFRSEFTRMVEQFYRDFSLDSNKKYLFYGTSSPSLFKENLRIIRFIVDNIRQNKIKQSCQLIVRPHPVYVLSGKEQVKNEYEKIKEFISQNKDVVKIIEPEVVQRKIGYDFSLDDQLKLGAILKISNILITQFSTLMLEAAFFDLPIINIGFDKFKNIGSSKDVVIQRTHLKRVLDTNFTKIAENEGDLISYINRYLENRSFEEKERAVIKDVEGGPNKGCAGEKIAEFLYGLIAKN